MRGRYSYQKNNVPEIKKNNARIINGIFRICKKILFIIQFPPARYEFFLPDGFPLL
jgi:hypothetical protein